MQETFTGTMRPRHHRFSEALKELVPELDVTLPTKGSRMAMKLTHMAGGIRQMSLPKSPFPIMLHQAIGSDEQPYISEFDVPLGLHNYHVDSYLAKGQEARAIMERDACKAICVFSHWARRSFALHFGEKVAEKCKVLYPLASRKAYGKPFQERSYDFTFIATQFAIKCGPQLVEAFQNIVQQYPEAKLCVVTRLAEAEKEREATKDMPQIEWREANFGENAIADLLADTRTLVHPSLVDSFGVVVVEALAAGCALITTDIASFPEMCRTGENGALITPPFAGVVNDSFITEYGTTDYVNKLLANMDLTRMTQAIQLTLGSFYANPEEVYKCMQASEKLYQENFSLAAWKQSMGELL